jgi:NADH:ubiquinone oxidoreductase 27 kD subunit
MADTVLKIDKSELLAKVKELQANGNRLVQISCVLADEFEITYSFDKELALTNLRVMVPRSDPVIPSITDIYLCAFGYENELQDLFGLTVPGMKLNFNGNFYMTAIKTPFNTGAKKQEAQ